MKRLEIPEIRGRRVVLRCRGCGEGYHGPNPLDLGAQWLATHFIGQAQTPEAERFPLSLEECNACGLVQLVDTVDRELLFRNYWYRSQISQTMRDHLQEVARWVQELVQLEPGDTIVDIGANDGTFLNNFAPVFHRIAIEPSDRGEEIDQSVNQVIRNFYRADLLPPGKAKLMTALAMFYDLDEPREFLRAAHGHLRQDGLLLIEVFDWPKLMRMGAFDTICHEHLLYFSPKTLVELALREGFYVANFARSSINGASFRILFHRNEHMSQVLLDRYYDDDLTHEDWDHFRERIYRSTDQVRDYLVRKQIQQLRGVGLGASTKGNVFLQAARLHHGLIDAIEDRDERKAGLRTVGTGIPIVLEDPWKHRTDIQWKLVLPWHFLPEIVERESSFLDQGGELIAGIPSFRVITRDNREAEVMSFRKEIE